MQYRKVNQNENEPGRMPGRNERSGCAGSDQGRRGSGSGEGEEDGREGDECQDDTGGAADATTEVAHPRRACPHENADRGHQGRSPHGGVVGVGLGVHEVHGESQHDHAAQGQP